MKKLLWLLMLVPMLTFGQAYTGGGNAYVPGISSGNGNYGPEGYCLTGTGTTTLPTWQVCGTGTGVSSVTGSSGVTASPTTGGVGVSLSSIATGNALANCSGMSGAPTATTDVSCLSATASTGSTSRTFASHFFDILNVKDFGALGDGSDQSAAIAADRTASGLSQGIGLFNGNYGAANVTPNVYGTGYTNALSQMFLLGTAASPTTNADPITWIEKYSAASRSVNTHEWDQSFYASLEETSSAYGASVTGYGVQNGGTGNLIGVHGRVNSLTGTGAIYGLWGYATIASGSTPIAVEAQELNIQNLSGVDPGWAPATCPCVQGLRIVMADSTAATNAATAALVTGPVTTGGSGGFHTGWWLQANAIIPTSGAEDNDEAILFDGPGTNSIGGIRYHAGNFKYALRMDEATFTANNALIFGTSQRLRWGDLSAGIYISGGTTSLVLGNGLLNVANPIAGTGSQTQGTPYGGLLQNAGSTVIDSLNDYFGPSVSLSGATSGQNIGTGGALLRIASSTITDTASTGTVTLIAANAIQVPTIAASSATTATETATFYIAGAPATGTNLTNATPRALYVAAGSSKLGGGVLVSGGTANVNVSSNFVTSIGTGTDTQPVNVGGGSNTVAIGSLETHTSAVESIGSTFTTSTCTNGSLVGGATAGEYIITGVSNNCVVALPTVAHGYSCSVSDTTTLADTQTMAASSTNSATFAGTTVTGDKIKFSCTAGAY